MVLGYFRPYSSGFRSYNGELRTDVQGFLDVFRGFQGGIGENVVLGNFRSYSMYIAVNSVLNSVVLDLIPVILVIPVALDLIPVNWKPTYKVFIIKLREYRRSGL